MACGQQSRLGRYSGKMTLLQTFCRPKPIFIPLNPSPRFQPKLPSLPISISASASASSSQNPGGAKPTSKRRSRKPQTPLQSEEHFPTTIPRKPRRGRRSEKVAVEDFVRDSLEQTFQEIRKQRSEVFDGREDVLKKKKAEKRSDSDDEDEDSDSDDEDDEGDDGGERAEVVEDEDPEWPADAEVGWGIRASDYFEKYPIKNVVVDGVEIDWEGELDDSWVKEINCLEWESFAFHPSPLIVLVFERYNKAADNWKVLKELENAIKVYWGSKSHLPPRTVKIDVNIEKDVAYALKVRECPQVLFLRGNRILYREKAFRTADELVKMIAFFYYNAKKPSWIDDAALAPPY